MDLEGTVIIQTGREKNENKEFPIPASVEKITYGKKPKVLFAMGKLTIDGKNCAKK